jgi:hypothetical protein
MPVPQINKIGNNKIKVNRKKEPFWLFFINDMGKAHFGIFFIKKNCCFGLFLIKKKKCQNGIKHYKNCHFSTFFYFNIYIMEIHLTILFNYSKEVGINSR